MDMIPERWETREKRLLRTWSESALDLNEPFPGWASGEGRKPRVALGHSPWWHSEQKNELLSQTFTVHHNIPDTMLRDDT